MTLSEEEVLEVTRAEVPSRKVAVAAAIVEERIDRRLGPHLVERFNDALGAAVRDEVLVRQREIHRPTMRCRATRAAKTGSTRWRPRRRARNGRPQSPSRPAGGT